MPTHKSWVVPPKVQGSSDYSNVRATRPFKVLFVIRAFALINIASLPDAARGNETGLFSPGFPPWPTPPNVLSWCRYERQCGHHGCASRWVCPPQTFVSAYLWQVQDHTPPEALARYDDAWCRVYGPRGSPEYLQCRENNYYTRLSVPIRATK
jgi:hypothetical protein